MVTSFVRRRPGLWRTSWEILAIVGVFLLELMFGSDDHEPDK